MKQVTLIIAALMACGSWTAAGGADEDRPRKKRELAPTTRPADHSDMDRPFGQHKRRYKGGQPHHRGRPAEHPRFGHRPGPHGDFDPKQMEEFMEFARAEFPLLYKHMKQARERHPGGWRQKFAGPFGKRIGELMRLRHENPELAEVVIAQHRHEVVVADLHRQYRQARTTEERDAIAAEIRSELETGFELRLKRLEIEIAQLQRRLHEARRSLADQELNRDKMIEAHIQKLLKSDAPPPPPPP
jgi:hypothetical protein